MNELDYFVKRNLKIKCYVRYMDDFILLLDSKKQCIDIKKKIEKFLLEELHLSLNEKSRYYPSAMGVNFCGYRIFETHRLLRTSSKKKIMKNVKIWNRQYTIGKLSIEDTMKSINSWLGHASHCNSFKLQKKVLNKCDFLVTDKTYENKEKELIKLIEEQLFER